MARIAIVTGVLLIAVGLIGFFATGAEHVTALIPAALGALLAVCGGLALKPGMRKHAMHAAALVALLGALGTARGLVTLLGWLAGEVEPGRRAATVSQGVTAVLCLVFLILAVRSFVMARRNRAAEGQAAGERG